MTGSFARITRRITKTILILGASGAAVATVREGWRFGLGFLLGAGLSYLSFWRWSKVVGALGGTAGARPAILMLIRFGVLAAGAYATIKYLEVSAVAVFLGLLVSAAAVLISVLLELIYGT